MKKLFISAALLLVLNVDSGAQSTKTMQAFTASYKYESAQEYTKAIQSLKEVYSDDFYEINLRLGWLSYLAGQQTESIKFYSNAIKLMPYAIEPKLGIVYPLSVLGNWNEVEKTYLSILTIDNNNTSVLYKLGLLYYNQKQYAKAEKHLQKILNLYPFDYDSLLLLAWTHLNQSHFNEAKLLFNKALLNTPTSASAAEGLKSIK